MARTDATTDRLRRCKDADDVFTAAGAEHVHLHMRAVVAGLSARAHQDHKDVVSIDILALADIVSMGHQ